MKDSLSAPMTFSIEVEPSVDTVPVMAAVSPPLLSAALSPLLSLLLLPQATRLRAMTSVSARAMNFFIMYISFSFGVVLFWMSHPYS